MKKFGRGMKATLLFPFKVLWKGIEVIVELFLAILEAIFD